jgi:hypothetical protein
MERSIWIGVHFFDTFIPNGLGYRLFPRGHNVFQDMLNGTPRGDDGFPNIPPRFFGARNAMYRKVIGLGIQDGPIDLSKLEDDLVADGPKLAPFIIDAFHPRAVLQPNNDMFLTPMLTAGLEDMYDHVLHLFTHNPSLFDWANGVVIEPCPLFLDQDQGTIQGWERIDGMDPITLTLTEAPHSFNSMSLPVDLTFTLNGASVVINRMGEGLAIQGENDLNRTHYIHIDDSWNLAPIEHKKIALDYLSKSGFKAFRPTPCYVQPIYHAAQEDGLDYGIEPLLVGDMVMPHIPSVFNYQSDFVLSSKLVSVRLLPYKYEHPVVTSNASRLDNDVFLDHEVHWDDIYVNPQVPGINKIVTSEDTRFEIAPFGFRDGFVFERISNEVKYSVHSAPSFSDRRYN